MKHYTDKSICIGYHKNVTMETNRQNTIRDTRNGSISHSLTRSSSFSCSQDILRRRDKNPLYFLSSHAQPNVRGNVLAILFSVLNFPLINACLQLRDINACLQLRDTY